MKKSYLLFLMFALWSSLTYATLPTPALVSPAHGASSQDVNVMLDWGASTGATYYEYKLSTNPALTGASAVSTGSNSYVYTSNLLFGTTYYWAVRARSVADSSDWTLTYQFITHDNITQVAPSSGATSQAVNLMLDWSTVNGITYYDMELDTSALFNSTQHQYQSVTSSYSYYYPSNLLFGTKYYWRVRARHTADTTQWSTVWNFTTHDNVYLVAPANGATAQDVNLMLDWSTVNGVTNYDVEYDTSAAFNSGLHQYQTITTSSSSYYPSNLLFGTKYYWRIRAHHSADTTSWSAVWNFTTHDNIYLVSPTNGATAQDVNPMLDWSTVNGITNYDIEIDTTSAFNSTLHQYQSISNSTSSYYPSNLFFGTKYYWRIRGRHSADTTQWSPVWNFTTNDAIYLVAPTNGAINQDVNVMLDWALVNGITNYDVEFDTSAAFNSTLHQYQTISTSTSSYYTSNLRFGTKYYWRARAHHSADTTQWSPVWNFTTHDTIYLVAPTNGAVNQTVNVMLDWAIVNGITNYDVEFDTAATLNSTQHVYQTISTSTSSYNTSNLLFATKYYWRIRAHHTTDTTSWSPVWNFTTTDGKPVHVSPANGATGISLNPTIDWNLVTGVTVYQYEYSVDSNFTNATPVGTGTTSQAGLVSLSYGETYFWRVRVYHTADTSDWSTPWKFTTLYQLTSAVQLCSPANGASSVAVSSVLLEWQTYTSAVFYEYSYATNASFTGAVNGTTTGITTTIATLNQGTTYYWKVRANNGSGYSPWSAVWSFSTTGIGTPILISPANGAINQPITSLVLDWLDAAGGTFYEYQYGTDINFTSPAPASATTTVSTVTINGLPLNTTYYWRVRTSDGTTQSPWSTVWSFTTVGLDIPVLVSPANGAINQPIASLVLDWQDATGGTFYEYQYGTDISFTSPAPVSATTTVSTVTINGLAINTTYYWRVRLSNGTTQSSWSTVWSFITVGLEAPVLVSPANGAVSQPVNSLVLDWNNTSNTTFYEYQYATEVTFASPVSATTTVSSVIINGLSYNTSYYWRVRSNDGNDYSAWSTVWSFTTDEFSGITEHSYEFKLYPNPTQEYVNLKFANSNSKRVDIYNLLGARVWSSETNEKTIQVDLRNLPSGLYVIKINEDSKIISKSFVKQ